MERRGEGRLGEGEEDSRGKGKGEERRGEDRMGNGTTNRHDIFINLTHDMGK